MESMEESRFFLLAKETKVVMVALSWKPAAFSMGTDIEVAGCSL
jgi:hypothetical protein